MLVTPCLRAEAPVAADPAATVRAAVRKGLALLEKEGMAWHEEKGCLSCHHTPFLVWTHQEARRRGLPVDLEKLDTWAGWCADNAQPKGGNDVLAELVVYLSRGTVPAAGDRHKKLEALPVQIVGFQKPDGSWKASGQFHSEQWAASEADEVTTMLMIQALGSAWVTDASRTAATLAASRERGLAWLKDHATKTPQGTRTHAMRLVLGKHLHQEASSLDVIHDTLLAQQQPDGGWSWKAGAEGGDPITTGEVLYALKTAGGRDMRAAETRAVAWLLKTQRDDGSWQQDHKRISAKIRKEANPKVDGIYTYWSTAWAVLGLLSTLLEAPEDKGVTATKGLLLNEPIRGTGS